MPTGAELDARAAALNGDGTALALVDAPRIPEEDLAEAIDGLPEQAARSLAEDIFSKKEPRRATTIRGVPVEYTTLTIPQVRYINDHCYRKVKGQLEAIYSELFPTVCIFALRVPGTDTPVFTMRQKADVLRLSETLSIANDILALCGLTKPEKDAIVGNSEAADTAA